MKEEVRNYEVEVKFTSLQSSIGFKMESEDLIVVKNFMEDFLTIFSPKNEDGEVKKLVKQLQYNSGLIKENIEEFAKKYGKIHPKINGIIPFFNKTKIGEPFIILINESYKPENFFEVIAFLKSLKEDRSFEDLYKEYHDLFGEVFKNYKVRSIGNYRIGIGNPIRKERICRFCRKTNPEVSFKKKAHAISEALGNKNVIIYDECDVCNETFGRNLEGDIITYLSIFRTIFQVNAKGGIKKIKGKNFEMIRGDDVNLKFYSIEDRPKDGKPYNLKLDFGKDVNMQNIYKTLCKFFISILDKRELPFFKKTINWINGSIEFDNLPKIAEVITYDNFTRQPILNYYLRKSDDKSLPYALCEFYFTCKLLVFIIPLSSKDINVFSEKNDWDYIFKTFKNLNNKKGWSLIDYSKDESVNLIVNLNSNILTKS